MAASGARYENIPLEDLEVSRSNVRRREITVDIEDLAHSLATLGLQQPVVVQPKGEKYEILIGQRRYLAAKHLGWESIDAKVLSQPLSELDAKVISFSENAQRRDLTPKDKAEICSFLMTQLGSVAAVAEHIGISETTVRKWLGYAAVPEPVKAIVEAGRISSQLATRISEYVSDVDKAVDIAERIAELRPAAPQRARILDAVEEYPDRPVDVIFRRAEEQRFQKEIVFVLPERWAEMIDRASRDLSREASEIAKDATIEWLERYTSLAIPMSAGRDS